MASARAESFELNDRNIRIPTHSAGYRQTTLSLNFPKRPIAMSDLWALVTGNSRERATKWWGGKSLRFGRQAFYVRWARRPCNEGSSSAIERILVVGVVFIAAPCAFAELKPTRQPISANAAAETNFMLSPLCVSLRRPGEPVGRKASRRVTVFIGEAMPLMSAESLKRVGMRLRSPGTMVRWLPYTTGTCAKSSERRQG